MSIRKILGTRIGNCDVAHHQAGFTLVEAIVVISIMGILAGLVYFSVTSILPGYRLNGAARAVRGDLFNAKMLSAKKNLEYRVVFIATGYDIQRGNSSSGSTAWTTELSRDFTDYSGVTVDTGATGNPSFNPRGTADTGETITLSNSTGDTKTITVSLAGRIKIN